jgi:hypothetical protein
MDQEKPVWLIDTAALAATIRTAVRGARTEEDVKMKMEPLLQGAFKQAGINVEIVRYEKGTGLRGRIDALYGYLIIEYEGPGKLGKKPSLKVSLDQAKQYLADEAAKHGPDTDAFLEKAVGVCIDDSQIAFVRYSRNPKIMHMPAPIRAVGDQSALFPTLTPMAGYQVQGPYPISSDSLANLIIYARSTARRKLTADDLARVFGPEEEVARTAVSALYTATMRGQRRGKRVATFFNEWQRIFGVVYGEAMEGTSGAADEAAALYGLAVGVHPKPLIFAIHTYYALLMKLVAVELLALQREVGVRPFVSNLVASSDAELAASLRDLESGHEFQAMGITNFLEADFFSWYLDVWDGSIAKALRHMIRALADFEPATPILAPEWTRDLLQHVYEFIVPQSLRHALGEYYTPDWLAEHTLALSGYDGDPSRRLLDPACGSGTFLVQALNRVVRHVETHPIVDPRSVARATLNNVVGFDINPLAVLAARTNYLIAFAPFLPYARPVSLPVYLCDSVVPPDRESVGSGPMFSEEVVVFRTQEHDFVFPPTMRDRAKIDTFTGEVMTGLRSKLEPAAFGKHLAKRMSLAGKDAERLQAVYTKIWELHLQDRDGIWAHYIKNAFAPVYLDRFDYVVGNPPWIRWGYLSAEYRARTLNLWKDYGLFSLKGHEARLGPGEKDFSMLFTYACVDRYVRDSGVLTFVITWEVFKSKGAGEGFRRFRIGDSGPDVGVDHVEDMVALQPFNAANKTCVFRMRRGASPQYPVTTVQWKCKKGVGRIRTEWSRSEVDAATTRTQLVSAPVDPNRPVSAWQTASAGAMTNTAGIKGPNPYKANIGMRAEPYGVFWLDVVGTRPDGKIIIENLHNRGKTELRRVRVAIEPDLVFPAVAGGNLTRFGIKSHFYVLMTQDVKTRRGIAQEIMLDSYALTLAYLTEFKAQLERRAAYQKYYFATTPSGERRATGPFWSMYNISEATVAPYRVAWKRMTNRMAATVLDEVDTPFGRKQVLGTDTTSFFAVSERREAHFLCALLNSSPLDEHVRSFSAAGRGFGSPSVTKEIAIPKFNPKDASHLALAAASTSAHAAVAAGQPAATFEQAIDDLARKLWNITG